MVVRKLIAQIPHVALHRDGFVRGCKCYRHTGAIFSPHAWCEACRKRRAAGTHPAQVFAVPPRPKYEPDPSWSKVCASTICDNLIPDAYENCPACIESFYP